MYYYYNKGKLLFCRHFIMPRRYADSTNVFNKEYVFSYPEDRDEIEVIFSQIKSGYIEESIFAASTRVGYTETAKQDFENEFAGKIPLNDDAWIKAWTPEEENYLDPDLNRDIEEREDDEPDAGKDEIIAKLKEEIQQIKGVLKKLQQAKDQLESEAEQQIEEISNHLDDAKGTLDKTQKRNVKLSGQVKNQQDTIELQEQKIFELVSDSEQLTELVKALRKEINRLQAENKQASESFDANTAELAQQHQAAIFTLEQKIGELNAQIALNRDQHAGELHDQKRQLKSEILELQKQTSELGTNLNDIQAELEAKDHALQAVEQQNAILTENLTGQAARIAELQNERLEQNAEQLTIIEEPHPMTDLVSDGESGYDSQTSSEQGDEEHEALDEQPHNHTIVANTNIEDEPVPAMATIVAPTANAEVNRDELPRAEAATPPAAQAPRPSKHQQQNLDSTAVWNAYLQHGGIKEKYFHDQLVRKGEKPALENRQHNELTLTTTRESRPTFELVELKKGDFIHSTALFDKAGGAPGEKVVSTIVQDHTGRVINKTKAPLSEKQQCLEALRQAEMLLNNYTPTGKKGEGILIEGDASNMLQGKRLIAALLLLKEQHPLLKNIKIVSAVPGCKVPEPADRTFSFIRGKQTQEQANKTFINEFLPADKIIEPMMTTQTKKQVESFLAVKALSHARIKEMREELQHGRQVAGNKVPLSENEKAIVQQHITAQTLVPGDKIDLDGKKDPGPRRNQ